MISVIWLHKIWYKGTIVSEDHADVSIKIEEEEQGQQDSPDYMAYIPVDISIGIACSWEEQKFKSICDISHLKLDSLKFKNERIFMPDCWLEVSIRKVLRPATSTQVFLGFPVSKSKRW